jgi:hypothetical protein
MMAGLVYLLRSGDSTVYKIGRTRNTVEKRKKGGLSTGNPDILHNIKTWECGNAANVFENLLHNTFVANHLSDRDATEFFDFTSTPEANVVAQIDALFADFQTEWQELPDLTQTDDVLIPSTTELELLVQERRNLQAKIKVLEYHVHNKDAKIKAMLGNHMGFEFQGRPVVTWKQQTTTRFDQQALKEKYPEIAKEFLKPTLSRVFRLF